MVQTNIPAGAGVLVWTGTPFQLDFSRNRLLSVSVNGIIHPALRFPAGASVEAFEKYLRGYGVGYVLLETNSYNLRELHSLRGAETTRYAIQRKEAEFGLYLRRILSVMAERDHVRYADGNMVLLELKEKTAAEQPAPANADRQAHPEQNSKPL